MTNRQFSFLILFRDRKQYIATIRYPILYVAIYWVWGVLGIYAIFNVSITFQLSTSSSNLVLLSKLATSDR